MDKKTDNSKVNKIKENIIGKLFCDNKSSAENKLVDSIIFQNWNIHNLDIKNHLYFENIISECGEKRGDNIDFNFYTSICESDVGTIFTGGVFDGILTKLNRFYYDKDDEKKIKLYKDFTDKIHSTGTKIFLKIKPNIGRGHYELFFGKPLGYSATFGSGFANESLFCFRISDGKCNDICVSAGDIAELAYRSNFDGVLVDCSDYNILGEMSSIEFNRRKFGYYSNTDEMQLKIIKEITERNNDQIVLFKITLASLIYEIYEKEFKRIKTIKKINLNKYEIVEKLITLVKNGVDGFVFELGSYETEFLSKFNEFEDNKMFLEYYEYIVKELSLTKVLNKFGEKPVIFAKENFNSLKDVESAIKNNVVNCFDVTRNILADNEFIRKIKTQISPKNCIKCCYCDKIAQNYNKIECLINPSLNYKLNKFNILHGKNVAVVGSGISGLVTSLTLANRGYNVDLFEREKEINPIGKKCTIWKFDSQYYKYLLFLEEKLKEFAKNNKINIYLNTPFLADEENIKKYQAIVVATGFHEKFLNVSGAILKNVKSIYDVLQTRKVSENKSKFIILAKTELSLKLALYLLSQKKKVTLIINDMSLFFNLPNSKRVYYNCMLKKLRASAIMFCKIKKIEEDSVELIINKKLSKFSLTDYLLNHKLNNQISYIAQSKTLDQDMFIYEPDIYPNNKLYYELVKKNFKGELYLVGNAMQEMDLAESIKTAYFVGNNI